MRNLILAVMCLTMLSVVQAASYEKQAADMDQVFLCDCDVGSTFIADGHACALTITEEGLAMKATTTGAPVWKEEVRKPLFHWGLSTFSHDWQWRPICWVSSCGGMPAIRRQG